MRTQRLHPLPGLVRAPVARGEENVPARSLQRHGHGGVTVFPLSAGRKIAEVVLEVVHAPFGKGFGVDELVIEGGRVARAGAHARAGVHAEEKAQVMHIVRKRLHPVGELDGVRHQASLPVALHQAPAVVDDDVAVAGFQVALVLHGAGGGADQFVGNIVAKGIPAVPAHGRGENIHGNPPCQKEFSSLYHRFRQNANFSFPPPECSMCTGREYKPGV